MPDEPFASKTLRPHQLLGRTGSAGPDGKAKKLVVPPFQRAFSWDTAQVAALWADMTDFMGSDAGPGAYFVGPIVYMYDDGNDQLLLLDGQQRFATITIILAALRNLMFSLEEILHGAGDKYASKAYEVGRDIEKDYLYLKEEPEKVFALTLNREDHAFFVTAVVEHPRQDPPARLKSHKLILKARSTIDRLLSDLLASRGYLDGGGSLQVSAARETVQLVKGMVEVLTRSLAMTAIRVSGEDEAFIIFETLNDRGLKLAISDLVLNFLMRKAGGDERELVRNNWSELLDTLGSEDTAEYLRRFWVSKQGDIKQGSLFAHIRKAVDEEGLSPRGLSSELAEQARVYMDLLDPEPAVFNEATSYVRALTGPLGDRRSIPLLLSAYRRFGPTTREFRDLARALVSLVIRYQLLGKRDPAAMEKVLYELASEVAHGKSFWGVIGRLRGLSPANEALKSDLENPRRLKKSQATYLVYKIAERAQGENAWSLNLDAVSLEHIFPQKAKAEDWPNMEQLAPYLWSLGNLTVIERQLNRRAGNKAFAAKAPVYEDSDIRLTREIPERWSDWTEDSVRDRMARLFEIAQDLWPEELI